MVDVDIESRIAYKQHLTVDEGAAITEMEKEGHKGGYGTTSFGRSMAMTKECVHQMYEVPFWIWYSEKYRENHPDICEQVEAAKDRPWTTAHLGHLMLYLAGISSQDFYREWANILSDRFGKRKRYICGKYRYEEYN